MIGLLRPGEDMDMLDMIDMIEQPVPAGRDG
jgi:hypothetical protein